jgi:hypothetical protein
MAGSSLWVPSHQGLTDDLPHRQTADTGRVVAVLDTVLVLDEGLTPQQQGPARAEDDPGAVRHAATPHESSIARAVRLSSSRQVHAPNQTSVSSDGSSRTSVTQMLRSATCSCTASASTCSV